MWQFFRTTSLAVWPKFIVKSHLESPLQISPQGSDSSAGGATNPMSVGPNESVPLWKFDGGGRRGIRLLGFNSPDFTSWIPVDKPGNYQTNLFAASSAAEGRVLAILAVQVERRTEGSHLVHILDARRRPPLRVENRSLTSTIVFQQKGCDFPVFTLGPGQFQSLAWPSLAAPLRLLVKCTQSGSTTAAGDSGLSARFAPGSSPSLQQGFVEYGLDQPGWCEGLPTSDLKANLRATVTASSGTKILGFTECETASVCSVDSWGTTGFFGSPQWSVAVPAIVTTVVNEQAESVMKIIIRSLGAEMSPLLRSHWVGFEFRVGRVTAVDVRTSLGRRLLDTRPSLLHTEVDPSNDWLMMRLDFKTAACAVHLGNMVCRIDALCWHFDTAFAREFSKILRPPISAKPEIVLLRMLLFKIELVSWDEWWLFVDHLVINEFRMSITVDAQPHFSTLTLSELIMHQQWHPGWAAFLEFLRRGYALRFWSQCSAADSRQLQVLNDLDRLLSLEL
jgi:hypothetical protein